MTREPVLTTAELEAMPYAEILDGYHDGLGNEPEPGDNHSKAYWHGWRNGMVDGRHAEPDCAMEILTADYLASLRHKRSAK